ncbi:MATE family efflux transporter [Alkalihalobacillus sp. LMS39]|uniref:MATE family efflux transporter n=1 Tax=Alkalihalobacillus sp. LMS39 TaxID=2924032 RepID=UPI001FB3F8EF|nr:MATE family efflux transporter [Alkalihalobacillus sp. LMS39]UOE96190.1 MATE family efflux transporter [Alkalihalobacillus sp. LMS39]
MKVNLSLKQQEQSFTNRHYLYLAIPLIISGISTPLLGAVDTAVIGQMGNASAIGGVAIGAVIFNTMYWLLGFLRVSTSGFTAQADGANNKNETILALLRPAIIAIVVGVLFIILQKPILQIALAVIGGNETVSTYAAEYYTIRIWGAPFLLLSYVIIGWLIGMGKVRLSLSTQIFMNSLNIGLDLLFVIQFGMGVVGVAYATVISEVVAVGLGISLILYSKKISFSSITRKMLFDIEPVKKMIRVNRDLFLRTVCLLTMTVMFTSKAASMGDTVLAANAILLQIHYIIAYFFGGFANASSIVVGRSIGARNYSLYRRAYFFSAQYGLLAAVVLSTGLFVFDDFIISMFTTSPEVMNTVHEYLVWMLIFPFVGFWALQLEGIYSGATEARAIRDGIFLSLLLFFTALWYLAPYGNDGLWIAFLLFSVGRSMFLSLFIKRVTQLHFNSVAPVVPKKGII